MKTFNYYFSKCHNVCGGMVCGLIHNKLAKGVFVALACGVLCLNEGWAQSDKHKKSKQTAKVEAEDSDKIYTVVEQMPMFPGGDADMMKFLAQTVQYPPVAAKNGVQGRVVVGFVVERDGSLTDVCILRGADPSLDREAMRVVKSMPNWTPGKHNGKLVRVRYQVPISFRLQ